MTSAIASSTDNSGALAAIFSKTTSSPAAMASARSLGDVPYTGANQPAVEPAGVPSAFAWHSSFRGSPSPNDAPTRIRPAGQSASCYPRGMPNAELPSSCRGEELIVSGTLASRVRGPFKKGSIVVDIDELPDRRQTTMTSAHVPPQGATELISRIDARPAAFRGVAKATM